MEFGRQEDQYTRLVPREKERLHDRIGRFAHEQNQQDLQPPGSGDSSFNISLRRISPSLGHHINQDQEHINSARPLGGGVEELQKNDQPENIWTHSIKMESESNRTKKEEENEHRMVISIQDDMSSSKGDNRGNDKLQNSLDAHQLSGYEFSQVVDNVDLDQLNDAH